MLRPPRAAERVDSQALDTQKLVPLAKIRVAEEPTTQFLTPRAPHIALESTAVADPHCGQTRAFAMIAG